MKPKEQKAVLKQECENQAPFLICILPMNLQIKADSALKIFESCDKTAIVNHSSSRVTYINVRILKQRFAFIKPPTGKGNELAVLDLLKVCDTTLMLISATTGDEFFDDWGLRIFNTIYTQSMPTPVVALMNLESLNPKRRLSVKAAAEKFISKLLHIEKIMQLNSNSEGLNVMRHIGGQKKNIIYNRINRPHLIGDHVDFIPNPDPTEVEGSLKVSGFLRGKPLDVNGLVHIVGLGDFQMSQIDAPQDPYKLDKSRNQEMLPDIPKIVAKADPTKQTSLEWKNMSDPICDEQKLSTGEEVDQSQIETEKVNSVEHIPKNYCTYQTSCIPVIEAVAVEENESDIDKVNSVQHISKNHCTYQTSCIPVIKTVAVEKYESEDDDLEDSGDDDDNDDSSSDNDDSSSDSNEEDSDEDENKSLDGDNENTESDTDEYTDTSSVSDADNNDEKFALQMYLQENPESVRKRKEAPINKIYHHENNFSMDLPARVKLREYKGLDSFRNSSCHQKENLSNNNAIKNQIINFEGTQSKVEEPKDKALPGWYITIYVANVSATKWESFKSAQLIHNVVIYGLMPQEHQMSVMNAVLRRIPDSEINIKSKERLVIQCDFRRFVANPVFSEQIHNYENLHKCKRYFRPRTTIYATFYATIQLPPAPVLVFRANLGSLDLVAKGEILPSDSERILLKHLVLGGHPFRSKKKYLIVRDMFFHNEDVDFFKSVKLRTKFGRVGCIKKSLGTHGHMKCYFRRRLRKGDNKVFMDLYKRVYPKWIHENNLQFVHKQTRIETTQPHENIEERN